VAYKQAIKISRYKYKKCSDRKKCQAMPSFVGIISGFLVPEGVKICPFPIVITMVCITGESYHPTSD